MACAWPGRLGADLTACFGDVARFFNLASIAPDRANARDDHNPRRLDD